LGPLGPGERGAVKDVVMFRGHAMVRSTHPTTLEVTTEEDLTENGDCIIGVGASKGCAGLDERLKDELRREGSRVTLRVVVGDEEFELKARGNPRLELTHPHDIVVRMSDFVSDRTLAVGAGAAARQVPRSMVAKLKDPRTAGRLEIEVS
jgi:uncharacterized protein